MKVSLSLSMAASLLLACSKGGEPPGSCLRPQANSCSEYAAAEAAAGKRMCSGMTWTPGEKSCPGPGRLGACEKSSGVELLYAGPPNNYTPASARIACEAAGGTFNP